MDNKAELLLQVTHDYKVLKSFEIMGWESMRNKYKDILKLVHEAVPDSPDCSEQLTIYDVL